MHCRSSGCTAGTTGPDVNSVCSSTSCSNCQPVFNETNPYASLGCSAFCCAIHQLLWPLITHLHCESTVLLCILILSVSESVSIPVDLCLRETDSLCVLLSLLCIFKSSVLSYAVTPLINTCMLVLDCDAVIIVGRGGDVK